MLPDLAKIQKYSKPALAQSFLVQKLLIQYAMPAVVNPIL